MYTIFHKKEIKTVIFLLNWAIRIRYNFKRLVLYLCTDFKIETMSFMRFLISKTFFKHLLIAVIGFFIFVFVLKFWLNYITNHSQKIQVPNLQNMSWGEVKQKLKELNLDFIVIDSASFNPNLPKKSVIEQNPEAGDFVKEKRKIYLTLNPSKYKDISVPDVNGDTKRQATTQLRSMGFIVGKDFTFVPDRGKNVVRGLIYKNKRIQPKDKLPLNAVIELILGDGKGN
jgi:hypothetical protein